MLMLFRMRSNTTFVTLPTFPLALEVRAESQNKVNHAAL